MPPDELTDRELLERGEMEILGRMPWSSNGTFLTEVCLDGRSTQAIYKPHRGERPLWDFPDGLFRREVAAYELSESLGWGLIPLTIVREDGPLGVGSLQAFVDANFEQHYFTLLEDETLHPTFRRLAAFDFVANNTDRKSGHCLIDASGRVWGIDNGLSFHASFKLRTVIWEFAGDPLDDATVGDLARLASDDLPNPLAALLGVFERDAVRARARALVRNGELPSDPSGQRYPWPLV